MAQRKRGAPFDGAATRTATRDPRRDRHRDPRPAPRPAPNLPFVSKHALTRRRFATNGRLGGMYRRGLEREQVADG